MGYATASFEAQGKESQSGGHQGLGQQNELLDKFTTELIYEACLVF